MKRASAAAIAEATSETPRQNETRFARSTTLPYGEAALMLARMRSRNWAGGAMLRAASKSGVRRRVHRSTAAAKSLFCDSSVCASRRSAADSVPSTYSPASASRGSSSAIETLLERDQAAPQQSLDRGDRPFEAF